MRKIILLIAFSLICTAGYSQKKKKGAKKAAATPTALAKADNLTAELIKNNFYVFVNNKPKKDTLVTKNFEGLKSPSDVKITPFTAKGSPLYAINWTEVTITETKLKTETATVIVTQIWDAASKTKVLDNSQTTTNIKEIVFLNNTQASETREKVRREGFEFTLLPEGDVLLKNKTQENKMIYDATLKKFVNMPTKRNKKRRT
ncbi:hypothetical protein [Flavobacterium sp. 3HN19-14]|uniref:hypothetical protein n=1 Tax=Flavobacterium sp. 3HN19-14 TaxID=3448133 RepID=UPI003EE36EBA